MGTAEAGTQAGDSKEAEARWVRRSVGVRSGVGWGDSEGHDLLDPGNTASAE